MLSPDALAPTAAVHQIEAGDMIGIAFFIVAGVGDPPTIRRDLDIAIGSLPVSERLDGERFEVNGIDLAITLQVLGLRFTNRGEVDGLAIGGPLRIVVVIFAARDLPRSSAERRIDDEDVSVSSGQRPSTIE